MIFNLFLALILFIFGIYIIGSSKDPEYQIVYNHELEWVYRKNDRVALVYTKNNKHYANIDGNIFGPYKGPFNGDYNAHMVHITDTLEIIRYTKNKKQYFTINGQEYGPFEETLYMEAGGNTWILEYIEDNQLYYLINDEKFGPYDYYAYPPSITDDQWAFFFKKDGESYVQTNQKLFGPYNSIQITYIDSDYTVVTYREKNRRMYTEINGEKFKGEAIHAKRVGDNFIVSISNVRGDKVSFWVNGTLYGPFQRVIDFDTSENQWAISYVEDNHAYIQTNAQKYGPYKYVKGSEIFAYKRISLGDNLTGFVEYFDDLMNQGKVIVNGKDIGTFEFRSVYPLSFHKDNWYFDYREAGDNILNYNGQIFNTGSRSVIIETKDEHWAFLQTIDDKKYYTVNGQKFGPYSEDTRFGLLKNNWYYTEFKDNNYHIIKVDY